jgi:hypothetical protein
MDCRDTSAAHTPDLAGRPLNGGASAAPDYNRRSFNAIIR